MKHKPQILAGAIALSVIMTLAATFAWFTSESSVKNRLATKSGPANVNIQEVFVEPDDWKPGQITTKEVSVVNTGESPALVRISFDELLTINLPAVGEASVFDATAQAAGKTPALMDNTSYTSSEWFEVTAQANTSKGGIKLAADYSPVKVYAKHSASGSLDSYSFAAWAPLTEANYSGKLQSVAYDQSFDKTNKTLTLKNVKYMTYQGAISATADWSVDKPAAADIAKSAAETKFNTSSDAKFSKTNGKYPNNIKLNHENIKDTPTPGFWFYNADDGYFYYIGRVESGKSTPNVMKSLTLGENAGIDYYSNLAFELTVKLNALQNTKDAVTAEWPSVTGVLKTALDAYCES
jgi:hypothetical protein